MLTIILLSIAMAVVTLVAGWLPLVFETMLDTTALSQFGAGVILGSSFLIVIPEAFEQIGHERLQWLAGFSIVVGFFLMLAISTWVLQYSTASNSESDDPPLFVTPPEDITWKNPRSWFSGISLTTLGLTVHAAADGIALGSTAGDTSKRLEFFVFLSILIHKAPAALSLTSILLENKRAAPLPQVKRDIVLFSLAGPVAAILLGGVISLLNWSKGTHTLSGICLAISGGTFLFVATHILDHPRAVTNKWRALSMNAGGALCALAASLVSE